MIVFQQPDSYGQVQDINTFGTYLFYYAILVINIKIFIISNSFSIWTVSVTLLSFTTLMITIGIMSAMKISVVYKEIMQMFD